MSGKILGSQLSDSTVTGANLALRWEDFRIPGSIGQIAATITPPEFVYHRGTLAAYRFRHNRDDDLNFPDIQFPHGGVPGIVKLHLRASALGMLRVHRDNAVANNAGAGMFLFSVDFHIQLQGLGTVNSNGSGGR